LRKKLTFLYRVRPCAIGVDIFAQISANVAESVMEKFAIVPKAASNKTGTTGISTNVHHKRYKNKILFYTMSDEYYDSETYELLFNKLTDDDKKYINTSKESIADFLFTRWRIIINSLSGNYYEQYLSQATMRERNDWFKKYVGNA
jgi:hypothetical protein